MTSSPCRLLQLHIRLRALMQPVLEHRFHPKRKWRWDICWPEQMLAVEVHGAVYRRGRHVRGDGFTADREKMNAGVEQGWRVLEYTTAQVESGEAINQIERVLNGPATQRRNDEVHSMRK